MNVASPSRNLINDLIDLVRGTATGLAIGCRRFGSYPVRWGWGGTPSAMGSSKRRRWDW